ncbi:MAG: sulfotransferase [Rhodobacteraceae bacterium]|nr:sulfotransferase [Paracoccaceae bacterium]
MQRPPILVTGSHRSGSTWVGNILALAPRAGYVHEPFNRHCMPGICRAGFPHWFQYVHEGDPESSHYRACLQDTLSWRYSPRAQLRNLQGVWDTARMLRDMSHFRLRRLLKERVIMKDPIAFFSSEWLARSFGMDVVMVIRHPAAFVASIKAAKWVLHYRTFLEQPALMEDLLADFREEIEAMAGQEDDTLQSAILLWRIIHQQISEWQTAHPDWIFLRHEDLSRDPEAEFRALYDRLGLEFTEKVRRDMQQYTGQQRSKGPQLYNRARIIRDSRSNILRWKERLSPEEIATIRQAVEPISSRFYTDADW